MSVSSLETVKSRIEAATIASKIAVFRVFRDNKPALDSVFDNTIATQKRIKSGDSSYLGSFHSGSDVLTTHATLRKALYS